MTRFARVSVGTAFLAACLCLLAGCNAPPAQAPARGTNPDNASRSGGPFDLAANESRGGHVLRRHVGKTDGDLQERLREERNISAASTYTDRATAESVIAEALSAQDARIKRWLHSPDDHPNLVLDHEARSSIGRTLHRNAGIAVPCSHALVVLKWRSSDDFIVLTSYPECR